MTWTPKCPTCVSVVNETLVGRDDFMTAPMIADATGLRAGQVTASLHHLYKHRAADFIAAPDGLWWFATPDTDTRLRTVDEMKPGQTRKRRPGYKRPRKGFHRD